MRIVFAAVSAGKNQLMYAKVRNLLGTQLNKSDMKDALKVSANCNYQATMIVDSGAFSAWNSGEEINIDSYIDFCHKYQEEHHEHFTELNYVNLDVIPGVVGKPITREDSEIGAQKSLENYLYMKKHGIKSLIPVYHQGEHIDWLKKILDTGATYIGISPSNDKCTNDRANWLDYVFKFVPSNVRTHGFAVTSWRLMYWYPWFSVDSITYKLQAGMGSFFLLNNDNTVSKYELSEFKDDIPKNFELRQNLEMQIQALDPSFSIESVRDSKTGHRCMINIMSLLKMEERINKDGHLHRHNQQQELFA
jgi:hypothetical protein